jgi:hypothetical protein
MEMQMRSLSKLIIELAVVGMAILLISGLSLSGELPDKVIKLNKDGIYSIQRIMSASGYHCKVISGEMLVYMPYNAIFTMVKVRMADTHEGRNYVLWHQFSPEKLLAIYRDATEDPNEPPYYPDKGLGAWMERKKTK